MIRLQGNEAVSFPSHHINSPLKRSSKPQNFTFNPTSDHGPKKKKKKSKEEKEKSTGFFKSTFFLKNYYGEYTRKI